MRKNPCTNPWSGPWIDHCNLLISQLSLKDDSNRRPQVNYDLSLPARITATLSHLATCALLKPAGVALTTYRPVNISPLNW